MSKKLLVSAFVIAFAATAVASPSFSVVEVDTSDAAGLTDFQVDPATWAAAGYRTYDLVLDTAGETWTTMYSLTTLTAGTFWNHIGGQTDEMAPDPADFAFFGLRAYDSFYTGMHDYPNLGDIPGDTRAAPGSPIQNTDTVREMEMFDWPDLDSNGVFTVARFTILPDPDSGIGIGTMSGTISTIENPDPMPFEIIIPEPASLMLLALGGLAIVRRR